MNARSYSTISQKLAPTSKYSFGCTQAGETNDSQNLEDGAEPAMDIKLNSVGYFQRKLRQRCY